MNLLNFKYKFPGRVVDCRRFRFECRSVLACRKAHIEVEDRLGENGAEIL